MKQVIRLSVLRTLQLAYISHFECVGVSFLRLSFINCWYTWISLVSYCVGFQLRKSLYQSLIFLGGLLLFVWLARLIGCVRSCLKEGWKERVEVVPRLAEIKRGQGVGVEAQKVNVFPVNDSWKNIAMWTRNKLSFSSGLCTMRVVLLLLNCL